MSPEFLAYSIQTALTVSRLIHHFRFNNFEQAEKILLKYIEVYDN